MPTVRDNGTRIRRFRELKATLRTDRSRPLVGLDIVRVQSGRFAGQTRISQSGRGLLRWALYHAAIGVARTTAGRARLAALKAKRHGDRFAGFKAIVELAAKPLPLSAARTRPGGSRTAARRSDGPPRWGVRDTPGADLGDADTRKVRDA